MESSTDNLPRVITEIVPEDDIIELDNYFYNFFNEIKTNTNQPRMNRILLRYIPKYKKFVIGSLGKYGGFSDCYYSEHNNELSHDSVLTIDRVKSILEYISTNKFMTSKFNLNIYYQVKENTRNMKFSSKFKCWTGNNTYYYDIKN
jgi:hypothetical protein